MKHDTTTLRHYAPGGQDRQTPHEQDKIYVVVAGSGTFAPAGWFHRFEDFSDGFAIWVFQGPKGGEANTI